jgi:tRNA(adenine34) deaminase
MAEQWTFKHADEQRIQGKVAEIGACAGSYRQLNQALEVKRQAWWDTHGRYLKLPGSPARQAYTLLIVEYLRLDPGEVPVIYEDDTRIVWRSANFCPTLEACLRLGLDTRQVCREGSEESVQHLIEHLDRRLRFRRNYDDGMRPFVDYCEESVELAE